MFQLGLENLLNDPKLQEKLEGKRGALVAHPASTDQQLRHSLELLKSNTKVNITCAFGPQHGMRGEKQDNMIESGDYKDPQYNIPVFSLYGAVRRPTQEMLDQFDVCLFDLQDVGCRIYTYLTTLVYLLEDCDRTNKELWVLDRPNPAGRPVEGSLLKPGFETFVGAAPILMRHGLTLGEIALWYVKTKQFSHIKLEVIKMSGYEPTKNQGWPDGLFPFVNPSPNIPQISSAKVFCGTVLIEGTYLSEGRGTTRPLEVIGAPDIEADKILKVMHELSSEWLTGAILRPCYFEPTFQKHVGRICSGLQIHVDHIGYKHESFKPYRLTALFLKALRQLKPDYEIWKNPPYEYEEKISPVDMLSGGSELRKWVDDPLATCSQFDELLREEEGVWSNQRQEFLLYK